MVIQALECSFKGSVWSKKLLYWVLIVEIEDRATRLSILLWISRVLFKLHFSCKIGLQNYNHKGMDSFDAGNFKADGRGVKCECDLS